MRVRTASGEPIADAVVTFRPSAAPRDSEPIGLKYDASVACYVAAVPAGDGMLAADRSGFQAQSFEVHAGPGLHDELIVLAAEGQATYFRGRARMPVDADADLLGVKLFRNTPAAMAKLDSAAKQLDLDPMVITELAKAQGLRLYQARPGQGATAVEQLTNLDVVEHAGSAMRWRDKSFSFLSRDVVVRFRKASVAQAAALAKSLDYVQTRDVRYSPSTFVWRWKWPATRALLPSIERIAGLGEVAWVEPNLIAAATAASGLADWLAPGLWDRHLVGLPDAWQALEDAGGHQHGRPDIVLAIWDFGVKSAAGAPVHHDFNGVLSDGTPKVASMYDFVRMSADNDVVLADYDHGSCVASVAAALAGNPPSAGGYGFGSTGAAPNVALMTIRADATSDLRIGDQFVWMSGFHPGLHFDRTAVNYPHHPRGRPTSSIAASGSNGPHVVENRTGRARLGDDVRSSGEGDALLLLCRQPARRTRTRTRPGPHTKRVLASASTWNGSVERYGAYSAYGRLELCAPADDDSRIHDPPAHWMVWGASHPGQGDLVKLAGDDHLAFRFVRRGGDHDRARFR